jgi:cytochrome c556
MKPSSRRIAFAALLIAASSGASAQQGPKPEDEIVYRQSVMTVIGRAMGPLGAMAKGKMAFDPAVAQKNASLIDALMELPWHSFGPGTEKGAPTRADTRIWKDSAKFKEAADTAQKAVANLATVSRTGDEARFKAAFGDVGKACKSCHDDFRLKHARH